MVSRASTALLDRKIAEWQQLAAPLRGVKAVSYHQDLIYLADRYGIEHGRDDRDQAGRSRHAGAPRGARRTTMKREQVKLVIREVAYEMPGLAQTLAERTNARVATISSMAGGFRAPGYMDSIEANLKALVAAVQGRARAEPSRNHYC